MDFPHIALDLVNRIFWKWILFHSTMNLSRAPYIHVCLGLFFRLYETLLKDVMLKLLTKLPVVVGGLYNCFRKMYKTSIIFVVKCMTHAHKEIYGVAPLVTNPSTANFNIRENPTVCNPLLLIAFEPILQTKILPDLGSNKHLSFSFIALID